jgi:putative membrane protein
MDLNRSGAARLSALFHRRERADRGLHLRLHLDYAHDEFALIRNNVPGAAVSLGMSTVGFALPLTSAIGHANDVVDLTIWGVIALIVQVIAYYLARIPLPDLSNRIAAGELGPAIWLGCASVTAGLINAASMST